MSDEAITGAATEAVKEVRRRWSWVDVVREHIYGTDRYRARLRWEAARRARRIAKKARDLDGEDALSEARLKRLRRLALRSELSRRYIGGIPSYSPHDLRHRRITLWHYGGVPLREIQERVGHSWASTTLGTYTHSMLQIRSRRRRSSHSCSRAVRSG